MQPLTGGVFIMAYVISEACIGCGACMAECPIGAISEADGVCVIEWAENIMEVIPSTAKTVTIEKISKNKRKITL